MLASEHVCVSGFIYLFFSANLFNSRQAFQNGHLPENKMDDILCPFITLIFAQLMVTVCCLLCNGQSGRGSDVTEKLRTGIRAAQRLKT